ncbi:MAG: hypothetical protein ACUZ8A_06680 [Candidatus Bathyanammoxibius sp.]
MGKYREKSVVDAVQVTDEWFDGEHPNPLHPLHVLVEPQKRTVVVHTSKGMRIIHVGSWVITAANGEMDTCKPDIFEQTYEAVDDAK